MRLEALAVRPLPSVLHFQVVRRAQVHLADQALRAVRLGQVVLKVQAVRPVPEILVVQLLHADLEFQAVHPNQEFLQKWRVCQHCFSVKKFAKHLCQFFHL